MIKAVRGTRDLLPPETALWNFVDRRCAMSSAPTTSGNSHADFRVDGVVCARVREDTDIVAKEMYTWEDRSRAASEKGQSLTLRPENTAGVVRAYIEHKLWDRGLKQAVLHRAAVSPRASAEGTLPAVLSDWRGGDGPASAGSESPARDAEVLEMLATLLDWLGITGWNLELNSVGCPQDRAAFNEALRKALEPVIGHMCVDCQRRAVTNPLRVFDCKVPEDQPMIESLPRISQFLDVDAASISRRYRKFSMRWVSRSY